MDWQEWAEDLRPSERDVLLESADGRVKNNYLAEKFEVTDTTISEALRQYRRVGLFKNIGGSGLYEHRLFALYREQADEPLLQLVIDELREEHGAELDAEDRAIMDMMERLIDADE